jgi:hypothetical protein
MAPLDDNLLIALRAARPAPGYDPSAASPEAAAMLAGILGDRQDAARPASPRRRPEVRRRLVLAVVPAIAVAGAAAVVAVSLTAPGAGGTRPTVAGVRTALLAAFVRDRADISYSTRTIRAASGPTVTQRAWTSPAFPAAGQRVRFRLFQFDSGVPLEDTESIYIADAAGVRLSLPTTKGPRGAEIIDVNYPSKTWSRQHSSSVLLAGGLSPAVIRKQIASGGFTVVGTVRLNGRRAVKITWTRSAGKTSLATTLWADARTYRPLRAVSALRARHGRLIETDTTDFRLLPATRANLRLLTPPIPAGFTRTARSPHF